MTFAQAKKAAILIVDDTPSNLEMLIDFLEDSGFKVAVAEDGESAVELAEYAPPDLILLDILMPGGIDGFETCHRLKKNQATQEIPVIFMTALSERIDKIKGLNLGAVDYITKPLEHEEVLARVNIHLHLQDLTKQLKEKNKRLEQEIQQRQQVELELREQAALLNITADAILVLDLHNKIRFWNQGAQRLYGWTVEAALGKNAAQLLYRGENLSQFENNQKILAESGSWQGELSQVTKAGKELIVASRWTLMRDDEGQPKSILVVNTDITEKKQLEVQFLRVQRQESIGILASGLAHDLNNALTPILASVQLLQNKLSDKQSQHLLTILERNTRRSADLIKQVLLFARGLEGEHTLLEVERLIAEIAQIFKQTFSKAIEIRTEILTPNLWTICGDATQLHQVLMNLCINACDAMPEGGILRISAQNVWIGSKSARLNIDAKVGPYVVITVSDTGTGIPREILEKIFEPFFTTKEVGKGTGLGLSTALGIIKSHGGFVKVLSEVGKGTEFQVALPVTQTPVTNELIDRGEEVLPGRGELILIVDDEESILEITKSLLEKKGYQVVAAYNGMEAMTLYQQYQEKIKAILLDIMMPKMDGFVTIKNLQKINPDVKVIATSGQVLSHQMLEQLGHSIKTFLPKPYTLQELLNQLQRALGLKS
ncbi:MAG: response regulator [Actinomycetota bacterium]